MSKATDRAISIDVDVDWCGCPIVFGITAHQATCPLAFVAEPERTAQDDQEAGYADWLDAPPGYEG
jgi:hypothetical protein